MHTSKVLSLDPGDTTGWALWNDDGVLLTYGNADFAVMLTNLSQTDYRFSAIIYEDFRLQKHRAVQQAGSRFVAAQVIGAAKLASLIHNCRTYVQEVTALTIAGMHSQIERPKNHATGHHVDAILHGYLWFEKQGLMPDTRVLLTP